MNLTTELINPAHSMVIGTVYNNNLQSKYHKIIRNTINSIFNQPKQEG